LIFLFIINETKIFAKNKILIETYKVSNFSSSAMSLFEKRNSIKYVLLNIYLLITLYLLSNIIILLKRYLRIYDDKILRKMQIK